MTNEYENQLLTGIRILELTAGPSGSYAARLFANCGASVYKVLRRGTPQSVFRDRNKHIIETVDLEDFFAVSRDLLRQHWNLVLWDSHVPKALETQLKQRQENSSVIGVCIQFPTDVDITEEYALQALAGWQALTGNPVHPPMRVGGNTAAYLIGAHVATAGLVALFEKSWTGKGRLVNVDALTTAVSALEGAYSTYLATKESRSRVGNRHHSLAPMSILPARDGWVFIGAPVDEKWELLAGWAGIEPRKQWLSNEGRRDDYRKLEKALQEWTRGLSTEELFLTGQAFRLPFAKVQTPQEVMCCPHLQARNVWTMSHHGVSGLRLPWKVNIGPVSSIYNTKPMGKTSWQGLRILDLTSMWSGPYCTRLLADMGAEVIKVEAPHRPDGIRANRGIKAPFFRELNRNKRGIQLDLRQEEARKVFLELVKISDVLVENFSPRVMANFGFTKEELWKLHPNLVILSLSAFGQTGPYRDFVGYGPTLEAMSGLAVLTGINGQPQLPGFSVSDIGAGIHGAFVLMAALIFSQRTGIGLQADVSQYEIACQFSAACLEQKKEREKEETVMIRDITAIASAGEISTVTLPEGDQVLGMPWYSSGWEPRSDSPPELGQHNRDVLQLIHNQGKWLRAL
ncbi:CaiB/BaiF CoA-transferase family protein [Bacillus rubiinfantis]|uniref:CaiB/BaiF CoA-transferase family protein n=1 Tax=Bacillus rubiinfantis TaxID=1499680 RepID=UPI0005A77A3E|nr:CoA transferase [Bacillus rubiinfantis]